MQRDSINLSYNYSSLSGEVGGGALFLGIDRYVRRHRYSFEPFKSEIGHGLYSLAIY